MSDSHTLRRVSDAFDWDTYVELNYSCKYTSRGEYRICCPSCGDTKFKCYVNPDKGLFNCFKCRFKTGNKDVFDFVAITEGIPRGKAIMRLLMDYTPTTPDDLRGALEDRLDGPEEAPVAGIRTIHSLPLGVKKLAPGASQRHWDYLLSRGLTTEEIQDYQTYYVPQKSLEIKGRDGKYRGNIGDRVLWPIYGGAHDLVAWQARTIDPNYRRGDKYIGCPDSDMSKTLWPYVPPYGDTAVLVEGTLDAIAVRRLNKTSSYCLFGKSVSREQMQLLKAWGVKNVILFLDKKDAKREIEKAAEELQMFVNKVFVLPLNDWPKTQDAGDCLRSGEYGTQSIEKALDEKVDVTSMAYTKWQLKF